MRVEEQSHRSQARIGPVGHELPRDRGGARVVASAPQLDLTADVVDEAVGLAPFTREVEIERGLGEKLSPAERHALFNTSVVTDLDQAPPDLVERARLRIHQRIAQSEAHRG